MSNNGHFIVYCTECKKVIMQCRCLNLNKGKEYEICVECINKKTQLASEKPIEPEEPEGEGGERYPIEI